MENSFASRFDHLNWQVKTCKDQWPRTLPSGSPRWTLEENLQGMFYKFVWPEVEPRTATLATLGVNLGTLPGRWIYYLPSRWHLKCERLTWESFQVLLSPLGPSLVQVWAVLNLAWNDGPELPMKTGGICKSNPLWRQYHSDSNTLPNVITNMGLTEMSRLPAQPKSLQDWKAPFLSLVLFWLLNFQRKHGREGWIRHKRLIQISRHHLAETNQQSFQ